MYTWNSAELGNAAILPRKAGDALKVATLTQLKVLLFAATCGSPFVDAAACAEALGGRASEADCADALRFWETEGVLMSTDGGNSPAPTAAIPAPKAAKSAPAKETAPVSPAPAATAVPKPAPAVKTVTAADVFEALSASFSTILSAVQEVLDNTPPEMAGDVMTNGITVSGGCANLFGLCERLSRELGVECHKADQPADCVALGAGRAIASEKASIENIYDVNLFSYDRSEWVQS